MAAKCMSGTKSLGIGISIDATLLDSALRLGPLFLASTPVQWLPPTRFLCEAFLQGNIYASCLLGLDPVMDKPGIMEEQGPMWCRW